MADPLSILTGTVTLVDVGVRLLHHFREIKKSLGTIEKDLAALDKETLSLEDACQAVRGYYFPEVTSPKVSPCISAQLSATSPGFRGTRETLLGELCRLLNDYSDAIARLKGVISGIRGGGPSGATHWEFLDKYGKIDRLKSRRKDLEECVHLINTYQNALQMVQAAIEREANARSFEDVSEKLQLLYKELQRRVPSYPRESIREASTSFADAAVTLRNTHFFIPQGVSDIFTGRAAQLRSLRQSLTVVATPHQRKFVIHGLGGSGKTQFCCKYALENKESYWGVFFIDASTPERITQTLKDIAKVAHRDETEGAALTWLSNVGKPWLLIIDNADDPNLELDNYFPKCNSGHILMTTRNEAFKWKGNIGDRYLSFNNLETEDATTLLLKASEQPQPWDKQCRTLARVIAKALGELALAIIYAGQTIRDRVSKLEHYLDFYKGRLEKLRKSPWKSTEGLHRNEKPDPIFKVFVTLEGCCEHLEARASVGVPSALDAIELLKVLAFFHHENISLDTFTRAMHNAHFEYEHKTQNKDENPPNMQGHMSWSEYLRTASITILQHLDNYLPDRLQLPSAVYEGRRSKNNINDSVGRINEAMLELTQMSLVMYNDHNGTYTMHPIVHQWARERPKMQILDQHTWADAAARVLSASLLLPPHGSTVEDERHAISLLSHVKHVQQLREPLSDVALRTQNILWSPRTIFKAIIGPERMTMYAKFSLVYAKTGQWKYAEELFSQVEASLSQLLTPRNKRSRNAKILLSAIYWEMGQPTTAARLQEEVLETCKTCLGPAHLDTFQAMSKLGHTFWLQGKYTAAQALLRPAVKGMETSLGGSHPDTLQAVDKLGLTVAKFWRKENLEEAYHLHTTVVRGLEVHRDYGPEHDGTLAAKENQCRTAVMLGSEKLINEASITMASVLAIRTRRLREDNPFTLLGMVNTAIVEGALGHLEEAEDLLTRAKAIATDNFDDQNHIGILFGIHTLGSVYMQQRRWADAMEVFLDLSERQRNMKAAQGGLGDNHPDRLGTLTDLARCHYELGKIDESIEVCSEAIQGFEEISAEVHPLTEGLMAARAKMILLKAGKLAVDGEISFPCVLFQERFRSDAHGP